MSIKKIHEANLIQEYQISIPYNKIQMLAKEELVKRSAKVKMPGFRPGKVPMSMLESQYKDSIQLDVVNKEISTLVSQVVKDNKLNVLNNDIKTLAGIKDGVISEDVEILVKFDLLPTITLPDFTKIKFDKINLVFSNDEIIDAENKFLDSLKEFSIISKKASKNGDLVTIDYTLTIDGIEKESRKDFQFILGQNQIFPECEENIIGLKKDAEKEFKAIIPDNYEDIGGKIGEFSVLVKEVKSAEIPKFDEDLAKKEGFDSVEELKANILKVFTDYFTTDINLIYKIKLFDDLESSLNFDVPPQYLQDEIDGLKKQIQEVSKDSKEVESYDEKKIEKIALRRLRIGMMLDYYGQEFNIKLSQEEMTKAFSNQIMQFPENIRQKAAEFYSKNAKATKSLFGPVLENKIVADILSKMEYEIKEYSVKELEDLVKSIEARSNLM